MIWLRAYNGGWSNNGGWTEAIITDPGIAPPVVTANNQTVAAGQQVALSSIFSVSGSGITQYRLWFSYPEGGSPAVGTLTNNGTAVALDQSVMLTSLSGLVYTASTTHGTDKIWLQAYNGNWSNNGVGIEADITDAGGTGTAAGQSVGAVASSPTIIAGATLEVNSPYEGTVTFAADTGTLKLDNSSSFVGTVAGMSGQDTIDFADINSATVEKPTYSGNDSGGTLVVTDGTHTASIALLIPTARGGRWSAVQVARLLEAAAISFQVASVGVVRA
jgi:hypothetical protein